jgi:AbrB family looped-hinge helix DNA binding protein
MVSKIQHKGQVTIPTKLRLQAGLSKGDLVEFSFQSGKIVITPKVIIDRSKFPTANSEYTHAQRKVIDQGIAQSEKELKQGLVYGPYENHTDFMVALREQAKKPYSTKAKRTKK